MHRHVIDIKYANRTLSSNLVKLITGIIVKMSLKQKLISRLLFKRN